MAARSEGAKREDSWPSVLNTREEEDSVFYEEQIGL